MKQAALESPAVSARDLTVRYRTRDARSHVVAVSGATFDIAHGEILGIMGASGSGKSTLASAVAARVGSGDTDVGFPEICGGTLSVLGTAIRRIRRGARRRLLPRVGYLPQDAADRLDPFLTVGEIVAEPLFAHNRRFNSRRARGLAAAMVDAVRLPLGLMTRLPYELSRGQRQRVALAKALILEPALLVADQPGGGIDVTARAGVLGVIHDIQATRDFSVLYVSNDLAVTAQLASRVAVLSGGVVIGIGPIDELLAHPTHPYLKGVARSRGLA